jgi:hypothetical protein
MFKRAFVSFMPLREKTNVERCSITLLTLSTPFVFTCRICDRKMLDTKAFTEDEEWYANIFPELPSDLGPGVPAVERCMYCDGEWFRKF